jgi:hypothetical protein
MSDRRIITIEALVRVTDDNDAIAQRAAMDQLLKNPALKALLSSAGIVLVGYRVDNHIRRESQG